MTQQEKERIEYEAKAKYDARAKDLYQWGCAFISVILIVLVLVIAISKQLAWIQ